MIEETDILHRFSNMRIGRSGEKRAPHKPLLVLWAIGRCVDGQRRLATYQLVHQELTLLLDRFGPHGRPKNTHHPFWRLQSDGVWEVDNANLIRTTKSKDAYVSDLRQYEISGGLTKPVYAILQNNRTLALQIAEILVAKHFPPVVQEEVLEATIAQMNGIHYSEATDHDEWTWTRRRWRDPSFRRRVLLAYRNTCAVCEFSAQFLDQPLAIDAAHIKWHEYKGPPIVENGLALCSLHHRLFDKGAFTVIPELKVKVSPDVRGVGVDSALGQYDNRTLRALPRRGFPLPSPQFLHWHGREVFKSPKILDPI
ncbi:MAG: HNH endonuclease [Gammaproteobacteria bacterium]|nr:HNH endonuclease [Gammaproteobacteria bacterium]